MKNVKQNWNELNYTDISFTPQISNMTPRDIKFFRNGFESAFKLLSEYVEDGADMDTARENVEKIMSIEVVDVAKVTNVKEKR